MNWLTRYLSIQHYHGELWILPSVDGTLSTRFTPCVSIQWHPFLELIFTLGTMIISQKLGWEYHEIQYVKRPKGYTQWGVEVLNNHYFNLQGGEENTDYIRGAIYCSLCDYSVSPSLLRSLLERWSPQTNTFMLSCGERTITLLDMLLMAGLPIVGEP